MAGSEPEQIIAADVVVGLVPPVHDGAVIAEAIRRIVQVIPPGPALLIHPPISLDGADAAVSESPWRIVADSRLAQDRSAIAQTLGDSFRVVYDTSRSAGARISVVIASELSTVTVGWIEGLMRPAIDGRFDLVAPCYESHPFEGLINRAILYPLIRALYGKRIRNPFGPDFGISGPLVERMSAGSKARVHPLASLAVEAATGGMKICQSHLGPRSLQKPDWPNLSSILSQVLAPVFLDVERHAAHWQRARTSEPIPEFGDPIVSTGPESPVEVAKFIESFALGTRNLVEVWGMILPPSTIVELRRLARQEPNAFRMPDETWARIIYDFALAYRLRTMNRDQMLRAMTPIYLGWLASYALELENASPEAVEQRLERLCLAYEKTKTYFVSRWRWPDRFNP